MKATRGLSFFVEQHVINFLLVNISRAYLVPIFENFS